MLYMSSSFWLLQVESRHFSKAGKDSTANKDEQTQKHSKQVVYLSENDCHFVNLLRPE